MFKRASLLSIFTLLLGVSCIAAETKKDEQLYYSVMGMDIPATDRLLQEGANPNYSSQGRSLLGWAAVTGDASLIRKLLNAGAKPDAVDKGGLTPLMLAIIGQHEQAVAALLEKKQNLKHLYPPGKTIAMLAVESGKVSIVKALLDAGADFNAADADGNTPALLAAQAMGGDATMYDIIALLGERKVDLNKSNAAYTPLYYAVEQENQKLVESLLTAGAKHSARTKDNKPPLVPGLRNLEIFKILLKAGASPNTRDSLGQPIVFLAMEDQNMKAVEALLQAGVDLNIPNRSKQTALDYAQGMGMIEIASLLQEYGAGATIAKEKNAKEKPAASLKRPPRNEYDALPKISMQQEMVTGGTDISYFSGASVKEIVAHYRNELPKNKWSIGKIETDDKTYAVLPVTRGQEQMSVTLSLGTDHQPPRVLVTLTPHGTLKVPALPRYPGSSPLFEQDTTAIYLTADPLLKVTDETSSLLQTAGWKGKLVAQTESMRHLAFTKNNTQLTVMISIAPAQDNKTTIQYSLQQN